VCELQKNRPAAAAALIIKESEKSAWAGATIFFSALAAKDTPGVRFY